MKLIRRNMDKSHLTCFLIDLSLPAKWLHRRDSLTERENFFSTGNHTKRPYFVVKKNAYYANAFGTVFSSFVRELSTKLLTCFNGQTSLLERSRSKVHLHMQCLQLKPSETVNSPLYTAIFLMNCFSRHFRFV